jgi:hypothetical protein
MNILELQLFYVSCTKGRFFVYIVPMFAIHRYHIFVKIFLVYITDKKQYTTTTMIEKHCIACNPSFHTIPYQALVIFGPIYTIYTKTWHNQLDKRLLIWLPWEAHPTLDIYISDSSHVHSSVPEEHHWNICCTYWKKQLFDLTDLYGQGHQKVKLYLLTFALTSIGYLVKFDWATVNIKGTRCKTVIFKLSDLVTYLPWKLCQGQHVTLIHRQVNLCQICYVWLQVLVAKMLTQLMKIAIFNP